jgi:hypothetical protein
MAFEFVFDNALVEDNKWINYKDLKYWKINGRLNKQKSEIADQNLNKQQLWLRSLIEFCFRRQKCTLNSKNK